MGKKYYREVPGSVARRAASAAVRLIAMLSDSFSMSVPPEHQSVCRNKEHAALALFGDCELPVISILQTPMLAILTNKRHEANRFLSFFLLLLPCSPAHEEPTKQCLVLGRFSLHEDLGHALAQSGILPSS